MHTDDLVAEVARQGGLGAQQVPHGPPRSPRFDRRCHVSVRPIVTTIKTASSATQWLPDCHLVAVGRDCLRSRGVVLSERRPRPLYGVAGSVHPMGFAVQFAGLAPSSRRWSRNRLARLMGGCTPNSLM